ncbi:hypothetical protein [Mucilaginibacter gynuensis]|uniref:hypothetical protein n=1 Tax=Mucilaginibacter gynuensis TaxID=1302236 RepID=UPI0031EBB0C4
MATTFGYAPKVAKTQVQQKASLPHEAYALQSGQNLGWNFCPAAQSLPTCNKFLCPPLRTTPPQFYPLSPEAVC